MELFNEKWTFAEVVDNIQTIRDKYEIIVDSFSDDKIWYRNKFVRKIKNEVYNFPFEEYKKDRIWNYMNRYDFFYVLKEIVNRLKDK